MFPARPLQNGPFSLAGAIPGADAARNLIAEMIETAFNRTIVFANRKGGCGKTTVAVNVSHGLCLLGRRVLLLDLDPQAHATLSLGIAPVDVDRHVGHMLEADADLSDIIMETGIPGLSVAPSARELMAFELSRAAHPGAETRLAERLSGRLTGYDYLIIDPPPTVGILTVSALVAASSVYIPMPMHFLAMEGLAEMTRLIYTVNANWNAGLRMRGVIPTFFNPNTRLARRISGEIRSLFGPDHLLPGIRMNVSLAEAPGHGRTVLDHAPKSAGAEDFATLARRIDSDTEDRAALARRIDADAEDRAALGRSIDAGTIDGEAP